MPRDFDTTTQILMQVLDGHTYAAVGKAHRLGKTAIEKRTKTLVERLRRHHGDILFHKHRFDVFTNDNVLPALEVLDPQDVVLYGVALDVCDKAAIEGLLEHRAHTRLFAVTDAMKPIDRDLGEHLLKEWGEEGVRMVKTSEVVVGGLVEQLAHSPA